MPHADRQFGNGTVLIDGGYLGTALRDENRTILDRNKRATNAGTVWDLFPVMRGAPIARAWAGIEAKMPDSLPVFGPSTKNEGVYQQFGFSTHGFQLGSGGRHGGDHHDRLLQRADRRSRYRALR